MEPDEINTLQTASSIESDYSASIAPVWHTLALVAGIVAISIEGAMRFSSHLGTTNRLVTYSHTAILELVLLAWVLLGVRLSKTSFRSLLGSFSWSLRSLASDIGIAIVFWIASMTVLSTASIAWSGVAAAVTHHTQMTEGGAQPSASKDQLLRGLSLLAPTNPAEIVAWTLLCILAGFAEEVVFRGYLQHQFTAWARGGLVAGCVSSAVIFGAMHGYEGVRGMFLITVFGVLFSTLALLRRNLRAGMLAHGWHDLFVGLTLAFLKLHHQI